MKYFFGAVATFTIGLLMAAKVISPSPLFIWNKTQSVEKGLYLRGSGHFQRGDIVAVMPPSNIRSFLTERGYLPEKVPLLKRISAIENDHVCRLKEKILINNSVIAVSSRHDSQGRKMPVWEGCFILTTNEYFLLNKHPKSLDGRYFSVTSDAHILGKYRLIIGVGTDEGHGNSSVSVEGFEAPGTAR